MNKFLLLLVLLSLLSGCAGLKPVQAWEKAHFAKPEMALDPDPHETRLRQHLYPSKEAAAGGSGVGSGGCGCK